NYLAGVFPATVQSSSDIAGRILDMELYDLPHDYFDRYREKIAAVSADDVAHVAQKYIDPDRALIVIVGNAAQVREPLGTLGFPLEDLDVDGNVLPVAKDPHPAFGHPLPAGEGTRDQIPLPAGEGTRDQIPLLVGESTRDQIPLLVGEGTRDQIPLLVGEGTRVQITLPAREGTRDQIPLPTGEGAAKRRVRASL